MSSSNSDSSEPVAAPWASARRATKIVATLGPASSDAAVLEALIGAGVNVVRLNFSHGTAAQHIERATRVRRIADRLGVAVAVMADLQGPKIRVGAFAGGKAALAAGSTFTLDAARTAPGDEHGVGLDYANLARDVKPGDVLLLDDGLIALRVRAMDGSAVRTQVDVGGVLSDHKGINKQGGGLTAPALTEKDHADIRIAMALQADYVAVSFPKSAADMVLARELCTAAAAPGHAPQLIAKIERAEAVGHLDKILAASDGIMVARGDLAVEVGNAAVPALQKKMIAMARRADKLVITATQMMESMIAAPQPTRAEVSDVANAVLDGTDAVMLSAETAVGRYPVATVREMATICAAAEEHDPLETTAVRSDVALYRIDQSIALGAVLTAYQLGAKAIVALTESGATALWMSRHRVRIPIYALTPQVRTLRKMALYRNVHPMRMAALHRRDDALAQAERDLRAQGVIRAGDVYAITCGEPMGAPGGTNMLKLCRVR